MTQKMDERFFKINIILIIIITGFYGIVKWIGGNTSSALIVLGCMVFMVLCYVFLRVRKFGIYVKGLFTSIFQLSIIFIISAGGTSLTDDYILFLASAVMAGVYFMPSYIIVQAGLANLFLAYSMIFSPISFGTPLSQTILCWVCLNLGYFIIYIVIKRGKSYIDDAHTKANQSEDLLNLITETSTHLKKNVKTTYNEIVTMTELVEGVKQSGNHLLQSNIEINNTVMEVNGIVRDMFRDTELCVTSAAQISETIELGNNVVLENDKNMADLIHELDTVDSSMTNLNFSITELEKEMDSIKKFSKEIESISRQTNILAINAAIEAAKTGSEGAGFAVVAEEVRTLAGQSKQCSDEISNAISTLSAVVESAKHESVKGTGAVSTSQQSFSVLRDSYGLLKQSFDDVDTSIDEQTVAIENIKAICSSLLERMHSVDANCKTNKQESGDLFDQILLYSDSMALLKKNADGIRILTEDINKSN